MATDIPKSPDPEWAATLKPDDLVTVVDPIPLRRVYDSKVLRITPSGLIRLAHLGGNLAETFRMDGRQHCRRGWTNPWPRHIVPAEVPASTTKREASLGRRSDAGAASGARPVPSQKEKNQ